MLDCSLRVFCLLTAHRARSRQLLQCQGLLLLHDLPECNDLRDHIVLASICWERVI